MFRKCARCGKKAESDIPYAHTGEVVCDECSNSMFVCGNCGTAYDWSDVANIAGQYCTDCEAKME